MRLFALFAAFVLLSAGGVRAEGVDRLTKPDGTYFIDTGKGVRFASSGFVCPDQVGEFYRQDLLLVDASDGGRDLGCRLFKDGDRSWFSVFVTRYDDNRSARTQFESYISEAQASTPPAGKGSALPAPLEPGAPPLPTHGQFWRDAKGQGQGVWLSRVGRWYVELRVTYAVEDREQVGEAAAALFEAVYRGVHDEVTSAPPGRVLAATP